MDISINVNNVKIHSSAWKYIYMQDWYNDSTRKFLILSNYSNTRHIFPDNDTKMPVTSS